MRRFLESIILHDGSEQKKEDKDDSDGIHVLDMETLEVVSIIKTGLGPDPMVIWYPPVISKSNSLD